MISVLVLGVLGQSQADSLSARALFMAMCATPTSTFASYVNSTSLWEDDFRDSTIALHGHKYGGFHYSKLDNSLVGCHLYFKSAPRQSPLSVTMALERARSCIPLMRGVTIDLTSGRQVRAQHPEVRFQFKRKRGNYKYWVDASISVNVETGDIVSISCPVGPKVIEENVSSISPDAAKNRALQHARTVLPNRTLVFQSIKEPWWIDLHGQFDYPQQFPNSCWATESSTLRAKAERHEGFLVYEVRLHREQNPAEKYTVKVDAVSGEPLYMSWEEDR